MNTQRSIARPCLSAYLVFVSLGSVGPSWSQEDSGRWLGMTNMLTPHEYHVSVAVGEKIYSVGGEEQGEFEEFDAKTNRCSILPRIPTSRVFLGAAAVDKRIYAIGGLSRTVDAHSTVEVYDVIKGAWSPCAELNVPRNRLAAVAVAGRVYAIGGMNAGGNTGVLEEYDPATDCWTKKTAMPTPRHGHSAVVVNNKILVVGGYGTEGPLATVEEYDSARDSWTRKADMPTPRGFFGLAVAKGQVFAIAGRVRKRLPVERYDPKTDGWTRLGDMPGSPRNRFGMAALGDKIYVLGGEPQGNPQTPRSILRYDPEVL